MLLLQKPGFADVERNPNERISNKFSFYLEQITQVIKPASVCFGLRLRKIRVHHGRSAVLTRDTLTVMCGGKTDPVLSIRNRSNRKCSRSQSYREGLI